MTSFLLNEEQGQLRESACDFLFKQSPVSLQRRLRESETEPGFDRALWKQSAELGWPAAVFPEEQGGLAVGYAGLGAIFEVMGRTLAALPLLSSVVLAGELLLRAGDATQRARWLPGIVAGERRFALALDESQRHDPAAAATRARREGDGWVLDGEKWFVIDGVGADALIVVARMEGDDLPGLFVVDSALAGVEIQRTRLVDSRNHARAQLRGVRVTGAERLVAI
ncbi:MAG TPA: acyl-CoA dehydrogenase family protein, partial [Ramlibacter sp.]|nr:acyl-CoA dehydrogenase family protein [Ramlibacter sp.]